MSGAIKTRKFNVALVGATGMVGEKMIQVLEERNFPVREFIPIASERSINKEVEFKSNRYPIVPLSDAVFQAVDIALFSAGAQVSRDYAPVAAEQGVIVIDNSSAWRMVENIPLVVPEVNPHTIHHHSGIIANPNCSTIQLVVVLKPLHKAFGLKRVVVSTYQAVSGSGKKAVQQLEEEIKTGRCGDPYYPHPIGYNCIPHIDVFLKNSYSREEMKIIEETRKIMELPELPITATTVRIPVRVGHSESVNIEFEKSFSIDEIFCVLRNAPGVVIQDDPELNLYPLPLYCEGRDEVFVGRIRRDESVKNGINLWIVADNLRKGAATNAVQIAEMLVD
ncbi:MAG: aspartate-semialdehyde dehydrogenase [Calditrichia bacterium]